MKKTFKIFIAILFIIAVSAILLRIFTPEDDWICSKGKWIKHGNPSTEKPSKECKEV